MAKKKSSDEHPTHCPAGHLLSPENVYGERQCKQCRSIETAQKAMKMTGMKRPMRSRRI